MSSYGYFQACVFDEKQKRRIFATIRVFRNIANNDSVGVRIVYSIRVRQQRSSGRRVSEKEPSSLLMAERLFLTAVFFQRITTYVTTCYDRCTYGN